MTDLRDLQALQQNIFLQLAYVQNYLPTKLMMVGRQQTFELIPTSLVVSNGQKPPMTSKQAKKAHQLATRGPKISRAEQRRLAAEELARQKKEYERERAAIKAKAVREKKAAKELGEREARRKMGLPEPSRFVRASQPTISRFVKSGNKRAWETDSIAEDSDTSTVCNDQESELLSEHRAKRVKAGDSEDEFGGFPSFSQSELGAVLEKVDSSASLENKQEVQIEDSVVKRIHAAGFPTAKKCSEEFPRDSFESVDDMATTQLLSEAAAAEKSSPRLQSPTIRAAFQATSPKPFATINPLPPISRIKSPLDKPKATGRPVLKDISINMLPPPLPAQTKGKRAISFAPYPPKPRTLPRLPPQSNLIRVSAPSATQAFLEDHLDDFFPSPSQEIRELLDDVDDLPSNTQIAQELGPELPITKPPEQDTFDDLILTQDFVLSSQDILEITTPCPLVSKPKRPDEPPQSTHTPFVKPKRRFFEEKDEDLLHAAIAESKALAVQQDRRDTEKRKASRLQESRNLAPQRDERESKRAGRTHRSFLRTVSNATDYGEDEFHDCEDELLAMC